jgi:cystathionine beta-synthase
VAVVPETLIILPTRTAREYPTIGSQGVPLEMFVRCMVALFVVWQPHIAAMRGHLQAHAKLSMTCCDISLSEASASSTKAGHTYFMRCNNILDAIGRTPLVRLNRINHGLKAQMYVKADYINPGGSVKDRIGVTMIDDAEKRGLLKPGGTIIEGTSGNTGMGLALVAAVRGYKMVCTITDKQSKEKVDLLKALGAEVIVCPTAVEPADPRSYYSVAKKLAREIPNSFYPNQYDNPMNPAAHYATTGPEIWQDTEGKITHFVCGMGTGGTISGAGKYLKEKNPAIQIVGVDPEGSLYYEFHKTGQVGKSRTYVVEGIGEDFFPSTMDMKILDDVIQVNDEECFVVARRLVKQEGIFTGGSGGGCLSAALRLAKSLDENALVVAFMPDTGMRYLSKVYNEEWMRERGYVDSAVAITAGEVVNAKHQTGKVRDLVIVRPYQTVFHALKTMQEQDISQIPVFEEASPIGTVYEDQILNLALQGKDLRKLVIREVMSKSLPTIPRTSPVERVTHILSHESPAVFVEMSETRFEILTKYDLMSTVASLMEQKR